MFNPCPAGGGPVENLLLFSGSFPNLDFLLFYLSVLRVYQLLDLDLDFESLGSMGLSD